jgi:hypothetical protein
MSDFISPTPYRTASAIRESFERTGRFKPSFRQDPMPTLPQYPVHEGSSASQTVTPRDWSQIPNTAYGKSQYQAPAMPKYIPSSAKKDFSKFSPRKYDQIPNTVFGHSQYLNADLGIGSRPLSAFASEYNPSTYFGAGGASIDKVAARQSGINEYEKAKAMCAEAPMFVPGLAEHYTLGPAGKQ